MSWWKGFSTCSPLGAANCVVWWDAWAVVVSLVAILATIFLGFMTLRLGLAANRATAAAVAIAKGEADARRRNETDERIVLLLWLAPEVGTQVVRARILAEKAREPDAREKFRTESATRAWYFAKLPELNLSVATSLRDRLHVLGHPLAGRLARAIGLSEALRTQFNVDYSTLSDELMESFFFNLASFLAVFQLDLEAVSDAAAQASADAGIKAGLAGK